MERFFLHIKKNLLPYALIAVSALIFFYKLDYSTVTSWDEGWYGSIARDIVRTGDLIDTRWDGKPFYDHPPMGFWLMAGSYKIFGVNEFSTRFVSALLGVMSIFLIYKIGEKLFKNKAVGLGASLILGTSVWYLIRVRSGNLDSPFVFFFLLTFYLSLISEENIKVFPMVAISFGALMMTKTLIGIVIIPLILLINYKHFISIKELRINILYFILGLFGFLAVVYPWYSFHIKNYPDFINYHFFNIGTRDKTFASYFKLMPQKTFFYIHMGIRKWYYVWILSVAFSLIGLRFLKKNFFLIMFWSALIIYPFITSEKTELWHLIPVYAPIALLISSMGYFICERILTLMNRYFFKNKKLKVDLISSVLLLAVIFTLSVIQFKNFYKEIYPNSRYEPDDVNISKRVAKYNQKIYLDDDYLPLAVFYSGKNIRTVGSLPDGEKTLKELITSKEDGYVVIARNWAVDDLNNYKIGYKLLEKNNSFSIITNK